jgi:hypothetical protein
VIVPIRAVAVAYGNTVVLRSSEIYSDTRHLIGQTLNDAGFSPDVAHPWQPADFTMYPQRFLRNEAIARTGAPLGQIIRGPGVSKQAVGQLVETLVMRVISTTQWMPKTAAGRPHL